MRNRTIQAHLADIQGLLWFLFGLGWKYFGKEVLCSCLMTVGLIWILFGVYIRISEAGRK